jgi:hypothetical protein
VADGGSGVWIDGGGRDKKPSNAGVRLNWRDCGGSRTVQWREGGRLAECVRRQGRRGRRDDQQVGGKEVGDVPQPQP